jgi:hypothetical protein
MEFIQREQNLSLGSLIQNALGNLIITRSFTSPFEKGGMRGFDEVMEQRAIRKSPLTPLLQRGVLVNAGK